MQTEEVMTAPGAGIGAEAKVDLGGLLSSMRVLFNALTQTGGSVTDQAGEVIEIVREVGIDTLVRSSREGSQKAMQLLGSLYVVMQQAAARGVQEAGELASTIAGKLDEAGYTIQFQGCAHHDCEH